MSGEKDGARITVGMKDENNATFTAANGLRVDKIIGSDRIALTGFTTTGLSHGSNPIVGDYISIRRIKYKQKKSLE